VVARARAQNKIKWNQMKIRGKTKRAAPERSETENAGTLTVRAIDFSCV